MSDYLKRMEDESKELSEKITKLEGFLFTKGINLTIEQARLLSIQLHAMKTYESVLDWRIFLETNKGSDKK